MRELPKYFEAEPGIQQDFLLSNADYPCWIGPWGDYKTTSLIIKAVSLSQLYPGNEGIIIRRQQKALRRNVISEFEKWIPLKVPTQPAEVVLPDCHSKIHFGHADNVVEFEIAIQGMNLGWVGMEQAEQYETADIFELFIGRVRRVLTPENALQDLLIQRGVMSKRVGDFNDLDGDERDRIEEEIKKLGYPVRPIMCVANAFGHNWLWKRWKKPHEDGTLLPGYAYFEGKSHQNRKYIPAATIRAWEQMKITAPRKYARYIMNSFEDYEIEGAYFADLMSDTLKAGWCEMDCLYDKTAPVYTFWDLGIRGLGATSIWFVQFVKDEIRCIDFACYQGKGMRYCSDELSNKGYAYAAHWLPHDVESRMQGEKIETRREILQRLRPHEDINVIPRHSLAEGHEAVRSILGGPDTGGKTKFSSKCEYGVEALNRYHRAVNKIRSTDEETVFLDRPDKGKWSHPADAFRGIAVVYRYGEVEGVVLGDIEAEPEWYVDEGYDHGVTNLLKVS